MRDSRGRFLPGPDRDRHAFTPEERRRGYRNAVIVLSALKDWGPFAWLYRRVRGYYRRRRRERRSSA
jgi:hypothetical protein